MVTVAYWQRIYVKSLFLNNQLFAKITFSVLEKIVVFNLIFNLKGSKYPQFLL